MFFKGCQRSLRLISLNHDFDFEAKDPRQKGIYTQSLFYLNYRTEREARYQNYKINLLWGATCLLLRKPLCLICVHLILQLRGQFMADGCPSSCLCPKKSIGAPILTLMFYQMDPLFESIWMDIFILAPFNGTERDLPLKWTCHCHHKWELPTKTTITSESSRL